MPTLWNQVMRVSSNQVTLFRAEMLEKHSTEWNEKCVEIYVPSVMVTLLFVVFCIIFAIFFI